MTTGTIIMLICLAIGTPAVVKMLFRSYIRPTEPVNRSQVDDETDDQCYYVKNKKDTAGISQIPAVSDTGIGIDTAWLANNLTEAQRLEVLALARTPKGKWVYSGKKLYTLFGGNYNEFVSTMRQLRDGQPDEMPEEPTVYTPIAGRPTKASYYSDPSLEYQTPP